jgi:2Fe-2S ferredoxin
MPKVSFIDKFGAESQVDCEIGATLMTSAKRAGIKGIEAECGGTLSCATCHVYIENADEKIAPASSSEDEMLEAVAAERKPVSRLACQIPITDGVDGIVVRIPETQF